MRSKPLRRSSYPRPRHSSGVLWILLSLLTLGLTALLAAAGRREIFEGFAPEPPRRRDPEPEDDATPEVEGEALWLCGPAGNLYIRDGGAAEHPEALSIVFLHSLGGNGGQWALQLDHVRRQRRGVALDFRGHGESDPAEDGDYSVAGLASDVAAVADQLSLRRFVLAGHSLGATVAIAYAAHHPERVAGLLLVDPNGDLSRLPEKESRPFLESLRADSLAELESYFRQLVVGGDPDAAGWVLEDLRLTHEDAVVKATESSLRYQPLPALERYKGPRLAIISDMNRLPYSLHNLLPDLPTHLMTGTGHWMMMDRPESFNRLLDGFVDNVDPDALPRRRP
jgi:pimeloyl-ACP methyl ester carboxylesterase